MTLLRTIWLSSGERAGWLKNTIKVELARSAHPGGINKRTHSFYLTHLFSFHFLFWDIFLSSPCFRENHALSSTCSSPEFKKALTVKAYHPPSLFIPFAHLPLLSYLGHPLTVFSLQALFGLLEVGVFVFVGRRLEVVVHGVGGAGCGCGYYVEQRGQKKAKAVLFDGHQSSKRVNKVSVRSEEKESKTVAADRSQHPPKANKGMPQMTLSPL